MIAANNIFSLTKYKNCWKKKKNCRNTKSHMINLFGFLLCSFLIHTRTQTHRMNSFCTAKWMWSVRQWQIECEVNMFRLFFHFVSFPWNAIHQHHFALLFFIELKSSSSIWKEKKEIQLNRAYGKSSPVNTIVWYFSIWKCGLRNANTKRKKKSNRRK